MLPYTTRILDTHLASDLDIYAGVMLTGLRGVGKTRTGSRLARSQLLLGTAEGRQLAMADPMGVLSNREYPLLVDEWQEAPDVLLDLKHLVDNRDANGLFIVTGSERNDLLRDVWPTTGRLIPVTMRGLVGRERFGDATAPSLFDRWDDPDERFTVPSAIPDLRQYIEIALEGGFPEALALRSEQERQKWLRSYARTTTTKDLATFGESVGRPRSTKKFADYLRAYATNTATTTSQRKLSQQSDIQPSTAENYHAVLSALGLTNDIPAWSGNPRVFAIVSRQKRHLSDTGLAAVLAGINSERAYQDDSWRGRILETFVISQLQVEADTSAYVANLYHYRDQADHEVDVIVEVGDNVFSFEVKAGVAPGLDDAKHMTWFRDRVGEDRFAGGVVFHTGQYRYRLDDKIEAVPICGLWGRREPPSMTLFS